VSPIRRRSTRPRPSCAKAERPLFYAAAASSIPARRRARLLTELIRLTGFPCTLTLMGLGAFPASDPQFLGMVGMHGMYESNWAMHDCDLMINIGARFDDRVTGRIAAFAPNSKKIHVDIDPSSINKNVRVDCRSSATSPMCWRT
jgi:acetolactate synthase-1/2/3 large subunit